MTKSETVKKIAKKFGADIIGIASVDRFSKAPEGHKPENFLPGAKSVIVMAKRIPVAVCRTIPAQFYYKAAYTDLNAWLRSLAYNMTLYLEDRGHEAFPVDPNVDERAREVNILSEKPEFKIKVLGDFSQRHALVMAGLGEIGGSAMAVVPKYGPRIRIVSVITDAPLEADPLRVGKRKFGICRPDKCGSLCSKSCPPKALPGDGTVDQFKCRNYRSPSHWSRDYFTKLAEETKKKPSHELISSGTNSPGCGICLKVCPIGRWKE